MQDTPARCGKENAIAALTEFAAQIRMNSKPMVTCERLVENQGDFLIKSRE